MSKTAPFGPAANCRQFLRRLPNASLHLRTLMIRTRLLAAAFSLAAILLCASASRAQENPNRPPGAQPAHKKSKPPPPVSTDAPVPNDPQPPADAQDRNRGTV